MNTLIAFLALVPAATMTARIAAEEQAPEPKALKPLSQMPEFANFTWLV